MKEGGEAGHMRGARGGKDAGGGYKGAVGVEAGLRLGPPYVVCSLFIPKGPHLQSIPVRPDKVVDEDV